MAIVDIPTYQEQLKPPPQEKVDTVHSPIEIPIALGLIALVGVLVFGNLLVKKR